MHTFTQQPGKKFPRADLHPGGSVIFEGDLDSVKAYKHRLANSNPRACRSPKRVDWYPSMGSWTGDMPPMGQNPREIGPKRDDLPSLFMGERKVPTKPQHLPTVRRDEVSASWPDHKGPHTVGSSGGGVCRSEEGVNRGVLRYGLGGSFQAASPSQD
jgi:hypothetical protein